MKKGIFISTCFLAMLISCNALAQNHVSLAKFKLYACNKKWRLWVRQEGESSDTFPLEDVKPVGYVFHKDNTLEAYTDDEDSAVAAKWDYSPKLNAYMLMLPEDMIKMEVLFINGNTLKVKLYEEEGEEPVTVIYKPVP
jgi:hypothetical protein